MTTYRDARTNAEKITDEIIKERVLAGIELLTEKYGPDWVDHIDPSRLILSSGKACVLGQVYDTEAVGTDHEDSGYSLGVAKLGIDGHEADYAFLESRNANYDQLDAAWQTVFTGVDYDA